MLGTDSAAQLEAQACSARPMWGLPLSCSLAQAATVGFVQSIHAAVLSLNEDFTDKFYFTAFVMSQKVRCSWPHIPACHHTLCGSPQMGWEPPSFPKPSSL